MKLKKDLKVDLILLCAMNLKKLNIWDKKWSIRYIIIIIIGEKRIE